MRAKVHEIAKLAEATGSVTIRSPDGVEIRPIARRPAGHFRAGGRQVCLFIVIVYVTNVASHVSPKPNNGPFQLSQCMRPPAKRRYEAHRLERDIAGGGESADRPGNNVPYCVIGQSRRRALSRWLVGPVGQRSVSAGCLATAPRTYSGHHAVSAGEVPAYG